MDYGLKHPTAIALNLKENIFFVATHFAIEKITPAGKIYLYLLFYSFLTSIYIGTISRFVGGRPGKVDGTGFEASFNRPYGIAIDQRTGNLFVTDQGNRLIRKVTPQGTYVYLIFTCICKHNTNQNMQGRSQHWLDQKMALRMEAAKQRSSLARVEYALTREVSRYLFVTVITKSGRSNSMVRSSCLSSAPSSSTSSRHD